MTCAIFNAIPFVDNGIERWSVCILDLHCLAVRVALTDKVVALTDKVQKQPLGAVRWKFHVLDTTTSAEKNNCSVKSGGTQAKLS